MIFDKRLGFLGLSLCCLIMALSNFIDPQVTRPAEGRWGTFFALLWDNFGGAVGIQIYWTLLAAIFFVIYLGSKK